MSTYLSVYDDMFDVMCIDFVVFDEITDYSSLFLNIIFKFY